MIPQKYRRFVVIRDQDVNRSVVIEISHSQATRRHRSGECRATLPADIFQSVPRIMEEQERFPILHVFVDLFDQIVGMPVG